MATSIQIQLSEMIENFEDFFNLIVLKAKESQLYDNPHKNLEKESHSNKSRKNTSPKNGQSSI